MEQYDVDSFAELFKQKYPGYKDKDNVELVEAVIEKYPQYKKAVKGYDTEEVVEVEEEGDGKKKAIKAQNKQLEDKYNIEQYEVLLSKANLSTDLASKIVSNTLSPTEKQQTKKVRQQFKAKKYNEERKRFQEDLTEELIKKRNFDLQVGAEDYIYEQDPETGKYKVDEKGNIKKYNKQALIEYLKGDEYSKLAGEDLNTAEDYVQFMNTHKGRKKGDSVFVIASELPEAEIQAQGNVVEKEQQAVDYLSDVIDYKKLFTEKEKDAAAQLENLLPSGYVIEETGIGNAIKIDLPGSGVEPLVLKTRYRPDDQEGYMDQVTRLEEYIKKTNPNVTEWKEQIKGVTDRYIRLQNTSYNPKNPLDGGVGLNNDQIGELDQKMSDINVLPETVTTSEYRKSGQYTTQSINDPYKAQREYANSLLINQYLTNPATAPKPTEEAVVNLTKQLVYDELEQDIINENFENYIESGSSFLQRGGMLDKKAEKQAMFTAGSMVLAKKENRALRDAQLKKDFAITNLGNQQKIFEKKSTTQTVEEWLKDGSTLNYQIEPGQAFYTNEEGRKIPATLYNEYTRDVAKIQQLGMIASEKYGDWSDQLNMKEDFEEKYKIWRQNTNQYERFLVTLGTAGLSTAKNIVYGGVQLAQGLNPMTYALKAAGVDGMKAAADVNLFLEDKINKEKEEYNFLNPAQFGKIDSVADAFDWTFNMTAETAPIIVAMILSGGGAGTSGMITSSAVAGSSSGGAKFSEMDIERREGKDISDAEYILKGTAYAVIEGSSAYWTTSAAISDAYSVFRSSGTVAEKFYKGAGDFLKNKSKDALKEGNIEGLGELYVAIGNNFIDGKPITSGAIESYTGGFIFGNVFTGVSTLQGMVTKDFNTQAEILNIQENVKARDKLVDANDKLEKELEALRKADPKSSKITSLEKEIEYNKDDINNLNSSIQTSIKQKEIQLREEGIKKDAGELYSKNQEKLADLRLEAQDIINNVDLDQSTKEKNLKRLNDRYNALNSAQQLFKNHQFFGHKWFAMLGNTDEDIKTDVEAITQEATKNIQEKKNDPTYSPTGNEINTEAVKIVDAKDYDANLVKAGNVAKDLDLTVESYETKEEAAEAIREMYKDDAATNESFENLGEEYADAILNQNTNGFFDPNKRIQVNIKENSVANQKPGVPLHESAHGATTLLIAKDPTAFEDAMRFLTSYLQSTQPELFAKMQLEGTNNLIKENKQSYDFEEVFSSFVEEMAEGNVKLEPGFAAKFGKLLNQSLRQITNGAFDLDFKGENDIVEFLTNLGNDLVKGKITAETKAELEATETVTPTSKIAASKKTDTKFSKTPLPTKGDNQIDMSRVIPRDSEGNYTMTKDEWITSPEFEALTNAFYDGRFDRLINKYLKSGDNIYNQPKEKIIKEVAGEVALDLYRFDPKTLGKAADLGTFITQRIRDWRVGDVTGKYKDKGLQTKSLDVPKVGTEQGSRTVGETIVDPGLDPSEILEKKEAEEIAKKEKGSINLRRALDIKEGSEIYNKVKNIVKKTFGTKLPSPTDPKFKKVVQDAFARELMSSVKELMGKPGSDKYKTFLQEYGEQIYDLIPQDVLNKSFEEFTIKGEENIGPLKVDEAIKEGLLPKDTPRTSGPTLFTRKKFDQQAWSDYHLAPTKGRPASKQTQLAQTVGKELGKDAVLEVLEDPKAFKRFTEIQKLQGKEVTAETKAKIAEKIGREPGVKFSNTKQKSLFDANPGTQLLAEQKNLIEIVKLYNAKPINAKTTEGKKELLDKIFFGEIDEKTGKYINPPLISFIPQSFVTTGTFTNGGVNTNLVATEGYLNAKTINKMRTSGLFGKVNAKEPVREYTLNDGSKIRNDNPKFISKEIQLKIKPVGTFLLANKVQLEAIIKDALEVNPNIFASENVNIKEAVKRQGYSAKLLKEMKEDPTSFFQKQESRRKGFKDILLDLNEAVQSNPSYFLPVVGGLMASTSGAQGHFGRTGSIVDFYNTLDLDNIEEHTEPASDLMKFFLNRMAQDNLKDYIDPALDSFFQGQLPLVFDRMLKSLPDSDNKFNYQNNIPAEYIADVLLGLKPVWIRYFNPNVNSQIRIDEKGNTHKGIDPNVIILSNGNSVAKQYGLEVNKKDLSPEVIEFQQNLLFKVFNGDINQSNATKELNIFIKKLAKKKFKAAKRNKNKLSQSGVVKTSDKLPNSEDIRQAEILDKALNVARDPNAPVKKIRVFDFDDTLARTKSGVKYTMPNETGKPQPGRKAILLVGSAGAGKSTLVNKLGLRKQGYKYVNQDVALDWLAKNAGLPKDMNEFTDAETSKWRDLQSTAAQAAKTKATRLQGEGSGVIIDATGSSSVGFEKTARELADAGYDAHIVFVDSSLDTALKRNKARGERKLTDTTVKNSYEAVQKNKREFSEYTGRMVMGKPLAKEFTEINTDDLKQGDPLPAEFISKINDFTSGYVKGRLTAEEFAQKGTELLEQGAEFDFSEFNKVKEGKKGPLLGVAKAIQEARGTKDVFILTARSAEAAPAIKEFLDSQGLDIPLQNITGLGDSSPLAKSGWMVDKAAEGYNDFYFADDHMANVDAVQAALEATGVKSKVQQAKIKFSLNTKRDLKWDSYKDDMGNTVNIAPFKIDGKNYEITIRNIPSNEKPGTFRNALLFGKTTGKTIQDGEKSANVLHYGYTKTGDAMKVISIVSNGLFDFVKKNNIDNLYFTAEGKSRVDLYKRLAKFWANKLGMNYTYEDGFWSHPDDVEANFTIATRELPKPKTKDFMDVTPSQPQAVKRVLNVVDVKSKVQKSKIKFSKNVDKMMNNIIYEKTGIEQYKEFSEVTAKARGRKTKSFDLIPPSAQDFGGLLYKLLAKGETGNTQWKWMQDHLIKPYGRAMNDLSVAQNQLMADFRALKESLIGIPKNLKKEAVQGFTNEDVVRVATWDRQGIKVEGISKKDLDSIRKYVEGKPDLTIFIDQLIAITKGDGYYYPGANWLAGTITTDFREGLRQVTRKNLLKQWEENVDLAFNESNMNKIEAAFGPKYREALENSLFRMKTGQNRRQGMSSIEQNFLDYLNNSVGAVMFLNARSAVLQTISAVNFLNWKDNNPAKAAAAFANQPRYWKDFMTLMNSDFLVDRRNGLKINVSESEIAEAAKTAKNTVKGVISLLLNKGFMFTQIADSFAIASGGATLYRNRIKTYMKEGMSEADATEKAFLDFRELAEESQQSARADKISQQQASTLGRLVLAFANTPSQYARIMDKAGKDLIAGRGDWKANMSKIAYYGVIQNLLFTALQSALFAYGMDDQEEEETRIFPEDKMLDTANSMADNLLRGIGVAGVILAQSKNMIIDLVKRSQKDPYFNPDAKAFPGPNYEDAVEKLLAISPPISIKYRKIKGGITDWYFNRWRPEASEPFNINNPSYRAASKVIAGVTNVPLDRLFQKIENIQGAMDDTNQTWQRVFMLLGWPKWQLETPKEKEKRKAKEKEERRNIRAEDKPSIYTKDEQVNILKQYELSDEEIKELKNEELRVNKIEQLRDSTKVTHTPQAIKSKPKPKVEKKDSTSYKPSSKVKTTSTSIPKKKSTRKKILLEDRTKRQARLYKLKKSDQLDTLKSLGLSGSMLDALKYEEDRVRKIEELYDKNK